MDWSKAKTILIVALLFANAILGYFVLTARGEARATSEIEFAKESKELLLRRDIRVEADIPPVPVELFSMTVEYELNEPFYINSKYFEGKGIRELSPDGTDQIYRGSELITIENGKLLKYENNGMIVSDGISTSFEEAKEIAETFLQDREYKIEDMNLTFWKETEEGYYLEYSKIMENAYVELGYTSFNISGDVVKSMERTWLNTIDIQQSSLVVVPAPKAILELLSIEDAHNKTITDISLCYYFDPEGQNNYEGYQQATQGNAVPAWRVQFSDGTKIVLDSE